VCAQGSLCVYGPLSLNLIAAFLFYSVPQGIENWLFVGSPRQFSRVSPWNQGGCGSPIDSVLELENAIVVDEVNGSDTSSLFDVDEMQLLGAALKDI